jgi:hypothetical protein
VRALKSDDKEVRRMIFFLKKVDNTKLYRFEKHRTKKEINMR